MSTFRQKTASRSRGPGTVGKSATRKLTAFMISAQPVARTPGHRLKIAGEQTLGEVAYSSGGVFALLGDFDGPVTYVRTGLGTLSKLSG
jgi:hypothetical protein